MSDEMIKNKTWQHEETGRITTCAIRPGNRWHEVDSAMDCEHEDLTGKICADKQYSGLRIAEFLQEIEGRLAGETERLRAFASAIMEAWPDGGIEGDDLQDIAVKHGMLAPETCFEPCGEWCKCNGIGGYDSDDWQHGVKCYRRTALLMGDLMANGENDGDTLSR